jgi:hypothetical protein
MTKKIDVYDTTGIITDKKCPKCGKNLVKINVSVEGAKSKVLSLQCPSPNCIYWKFDKKTGDKVVQELREKEMALKLKHKIIKLSKGRLGLYFNKDIIQSLGLKAGEEVKVTVPDKRHIVIGIGK